MQRSINKIYPNVKKEMVMKMKLVKEYILFDLDGTLTDPKEGITKSVQYALYKLGIEEKNLDNLESFIGPALKDSFKQFYDLDEPQIQEAIGYYRERFEVVGWRENKVYPKIAHLLKRLRSRGFRLAIASSKPTIFVEKILKHFHLEHYFDVIVGSELDGTRVEKEEVIAEVLAQLFFQYKIPREKVVMVGDRRFDIQGAKVHGLDSVGVVYGYGGRIELEEAGADYIFATVDELLEYLIPVENAVRRSSLLYRWLQTLMPYLVFVLSRQVAIYMGYYLLAGSVMRGIGEGNIYASFIDEKVVPTSLGIALLTIGSFMFASMTIWALYKDYVLNHERQADNVQRKKIAIGEYSIVMLSTISLTIALNLFLSLSGFVGFFIEYAEIATTQNDISVTMGVVVYALVAPFAEELFFRGVLYQRCVAGFSVKFAIFFSSLLFGVYHGNMVQGVFAFFMGCFISILYNQYSYLWVPIAIHSCMNITSFLLNVFSQQVQAYMNWHTCIIAFIITTMGVWWLYQKHRTIYIQFPKSNKFKVY